MIVSLKIPGEPFAWQRRGTRARISATGKPYAHSYEPKSQKLYKQTAIQLMRLAMEGRPPLTGPVYLRATFVFACPKSKQRKRNPAKRAWYVGKKDLSNCIKVVEDAANGVLWEDDRQVAGIDASAIVGAQGEEPCVYLWVEELEELPT